MKILKSYFVHKIIFTLALCASFPSFANTLDPMQVSLVSQSKYWHRLMHYKPDLLFSGVHSLLDGPEFFFAPDGNSNPKAELLATIAAFSKNIQVGKLKQHPQCAFPERYRYLKKEFHLNTTDVKCEKLDEFLSRFKASSMTLVFSSAYPNNPGSMFGHTFLRINAAAISGQKKIDILDQGLNFSAFVGQDDGGIAFMWYGLTGGYIGSFAALPYYDKVNEYSDSESRDLWEYDLNVTPEETRRLLTHAWELETNSYFEYYFFDENCSYQLLSLLEVAKPEWTLTNFAIHVIPVETLKRVTEIKGAVRAVHFRPSLRRRMMTKIKSLNPSDRRDFFSILSRAKNVSEINNPDILEGLASYLFYEKNKHGNKLNPLDQELLAAVLEQRSMIPSDSTNKVSGIQKMSSQFIQNNRPDKGHSEYRLGVSTGVQKGLYAFQEIDFKFAYHDLLNRDVGYTRFSQIDFPGATLRYIPAAKKLNIEKIRGIEITSLFPMTFIEKRASWRASADFYSPKDLNCNYCHAFRGELGAGLTFTPFTENHIIYGLAMANGEVGQTFRKGFRIGPKLILASLWNPSDRYKIQLSSTLASDLFQNDRQKLYYELEWNQSYSFSQNWDVRTALLAVLPTLESGASYQEAKLMLNMYF